MFLMDGQNVLIVGQKHFRQKNFISDEPRICDLIFLNTIHIVPIKVLRGPNLTR